MPMSIELMKAINSALRTLPQIDMINRFPTQPYRCRYEFPDLLKFAKLLQSVRGYEFRSADILKELDLPTLRLRRNNISGK